MHVFLSILNIINIISIINFDAVAKTEVGDGQETRDQ